MKTLFIINSHSVIDVITNSSSELFVCKTDKTLEVINEILKTKNLGEYQEPWIFSLKEFREWKVKEKERRIKWDEGDHSAISDEDYNHHFHTIDGWFKDDECEEDIIYARKHIIENGPQTTQWLGTYAYSGHAANPFQDRLCAAQGPKYDWKKKEAEVNKIYTELETAEYKPSWWKTPIKYTYHETTVSELDGCVIIISADDNSMNYDEFEWIEETFNASRTHLG